MLTHSCFLLRVHFDKIQCIEAAEFYRIWSNICWWLSLWRKKDRTTKQDILLCNRKHYIALSVMILWAYDECKVLAVLYYYCVWKAHFDLAPWTWINVERIPIRITTALPFPASTHKSNHIFMLPLYTLPHRTPSFHFIRIFPLRSHIYRHISTFFSSGFSIRFLLEVLNGRKWIGRWIELNWIDLNKKGVRVARSFFFSRHSNIKPWIATKTIRKL